jgi:hypothetical protein
MVGDPGVARRGSALEFARSWPNQHEVTVPGRYAYRVASSRTVAMSLNGSSSSLTIW